MNKLLLVILVTAILAIFNWVPASAAPIAGWSNLTNYGPVDMYGFGSTIDANGTIWTVGGLGTEQGSIWKSSNGVDWYCTTKNAKLGKNSPYSLASGTLLYYKSALFAIGGINGDGDSGQVYRSTDTNHINWVNITNTGYAYGTSYVIHNNLIYAIEPDSTCHTSADGIGWTSTTPFVPTALEYNRTLLSYNGKIYSFGAFDGAVGDKHSYSSPDGNIWTLLNSNVQFGAVYNMRGVVADNIMYAMGGVNGSTIQNGVLISTDGITWSYPSAFTDLYVNMSQFGAIVKGTSIIAFFGENGSGINRTVLLSSQITAPTATLTKTFTNTVTNTFTSTNTSTFSPTATKTSTRTPYATSTVTFSISPTSTITRTNTPINTIGTYNPTKTSTITPTFTITPTNTPIETPLINYVSTDLTGGDAIICLGAVSWSRYPDMGQVTNYILTVKNTTINTTTTYYLTNADNLDVTSDKRFLWKMEGMIFNNVYSFQLKVQNPVSVLTPMIAATIVITPGVLPMSAPTVTP